MKLSLRKKICITLLTIIFLSFTIELRYINYSPSPIHGYWETGDQFWQIPASYRLSKDKFYTKDVIVAEYAKIYPTKLFYLMSLIYNLIGDMFITYSVVLLALKVIFIVSTFLLSNYLLKNYKHALVSTLITSLTHFMGAEEIGVSEVIPRNFVFAFIPIIIYFFLKHRKKYCPLIFLALGILAYFHSESIFPLVILFLFSLILREKEYKIAIISVIIFGLIFIPYFINVFIERDAFDIELYKIVHKDGYMFLPHVFITTAKYFIPVSIGFFVVFKKNKEFFFWFLLLLSYTLLQMLGLINEILYVFAFYKAFKLIIYFSFIFSAIFLSRIWEKTKILALVVFILIFFPFSSLFYSNILKGITKAESICLEKNDDAIRLGEWINNNTEKDALLLIPPEWAQIRGWSKRSIVISCGGGVATYSKRVGDIWESRYNLVNEVYSNTSSSTEDFLSLAKKFDADYIVTFNKTLNLYKRVAIEDFNVYEVKR